MSTGFLLPNTDRMSLMYAKARQGLITGFTGVDDPHEVPVNPEITLTTLSFTPEQNVAKIILYLEVNGYLPVSLAPSGLNGSNGQKANGSNVHKL